MSFIEITKEMLDVAFTENGDKAYKTTGSYCLDYFSLVGGMRFNFASALTNFMKAYKEDGFNFAYTYRSKSTGKILIEERLSEEDYK